MDGQKGHNRRRPEGQRESKQVQITDRQGTLNIPVKFHGKFPQRSLETMITKWIKGQNKVKNKR